MKRLRLSAAFAAAPLLLMLAGCSASEPAQATDDKRACQKYASVISDWAVNGNESEVATTGVAIKLRSEVIPLASDKLAKPVESIAKMMDANEQQPDSDDAGKQIKKICEAVGVHW